MRRRYSHSDIEKWAECSGDRNKIHFDKSEAKRNGLKDIIVQGMLVLLDAKRALSPSILSDSSINFFIKKPVTVNTDIIFDVKDVRKGKALKVYESGDPESACVTATVLAKSVPELSATDNQIQLSKEFVKKYMDAIDKYYSDLDENWIVLDTLIFFMSFNQQKEDYFYRQALKLTGDTELSDVVTFHVCHKIFISKTLLNSNALRLQDMSFVLEEKDVYVHDDSAYSTFNISVIENEKIIYQSSIGCMTQAST